MHSVREFFDQTSGNASSASAGRNGPKAEGRGMLLSTIIQKLSTVRVLCIGDVMLDHFVYGRVNRISPEAPVPVFNRDSDKTMLGGVGNVLSNGASLGCQVDIVCLRGDDAPGRRLEAKIREVCPDPLCIVVPDVPTIEKTRIIAGNNHLIRIDTECMFTGNPFSRQEMYSELAARIRRADIILLSDYGKGFLSPETCRTIMSLAMNAGKPVLVDPKGSDYGKYAGAALVKPNLKEFMQASGVRTDPSDQDFKQKLCDGARSLMQRGGFANLLVTLSEHGMIFVSADASMPPVHMPTEAREVFDVSGAGDTCLAVLGAGLGAGADIGEAMKLANLAAGIVVGKLGTSSISAAELAEHLSRRDKSADGGQHWTQKHKIISPEQAAAVACEARAGGLSVGFTNGCFDLLHRGHLQSLMQARQQSDILIVGINSDRSVRRLKGASRPVQDEKTRALLLASLEFVDFVVVFDEDTALPLVEKILPDRIFKEGYSLDGWPEGRFVASHGGMAVSLAHVDGCSTTGLVRSIMSRSEVAQ